MSESDDTDILLSIPANYFVISDSDNEVDLTKKNQLFLDEVDKFLHSLNSSVNTPTTTNSEINNKIIYSPINNNSENNLDSNSHIKKLEENIKNKDNEIENLTYSIKNLTIQNIEFQNKLNTIENNEKQLLQKNNELKYNIGQLEETLHQFKNQTHMNPKYNKYEDERLDLLNKIEYSTSKIRILSEENLKLMNRESIYKEEIASLKLKLGKIKNIYQNQLDQALHLKKGEFENQVLQIKKIFDEKIYLKNHEIKTLEQQMKTNSHEYNNEFTHFKKVHEEKIRELSTSVKYLINQNEKMYNLIKLFKKHQRNCPFYLEERINFDIATIDRDIPSNRIIPSLENESDIDDNNLISYIKQLLIMRPTLSEASNISSSQQSTHSSNRSQESTKQSKHSQEDNLKLSSRSQSKVKEKPAKRPWK